MHSTSVEREQSRNVVIVAQLNELELKFSNLKEIGTCLAIDYRMLESLHFRRMEARHEKIVDAHAETFRWIFGS